MSASNFNYAKLTLMCPKLQLKKKLNNKRKFDVFLCSKLNYHRRLVIS